MAIVKENVILVLKNTGKQPTEKSSKINITRPRRTIVKNTKLNPDRRRWKLDHIRVQFKPTNVSMTQAKAYHVFIRQRLRDMLNKLTATH